MLTPEAVPATGQARLDYLRGDRTFERRNGGPFRDRDPLSALGDFVNSAPVYVGRPLARYPNGLESAAYSGFRDANASRTPMVYIAGNDGMFHAFDAETGVEAWSFIPGTAFPKLKPLTDLNFQHKYLFDGSPAVGDAYWSGNWHSVAVTALGLGGQSVLAMDVTNPDATSEIDVANKFLWEFTDQDDVDMGFVPGKPVIARMKNGKWAAIFGNGYNNTVADGRASSSGNGVLYIIDISNGSLIRKLDTRVGMTADPLSQARPNGLAPPAVVDLDGDFIADYIYAGDLFGNLWKIDVRDSNASNWNFAFLDASTNPLPLHTARNGASGVQPITSRPTVGAGPEGVGMMVYFGTGKFLELADRNLALLTTQSFYGIVDANGGTSADRVIGRGSLVAQTILSESSIMLGGESSAARVTSANPLAANRGWYLDLISPGPTFMGEMQVTDSVLRNGQIIFTTLVPNPDPCGFGGSSWLMALDALSGARLGSTFDLNGDGQFGSSDKVTEGGVDVAPSGVQSTQGIAPRPAVITDGTRDYIILPGTRPPEDDDPDAGAGTFQSTLDPGAGAYGRQSWRQLR
jgi:type IV pilus assembly protein PilY1